MQLAFLIAAMNDLQILTVDIGNAYLNATTKEKVHTVCGAEFGERYVGRIAVIHKALYGLKTSVAAWHSMFAGTLTGLQFKSSLADPNVWLREATEPNGEEYYEYLFVYVDDVLILSNNTDAIVESLHQHYHLKEDSVGKPKTYLGAEIKEFKDTHNPGINMWSMSADKYLKEAIKNVEYDLYRMNLKLPTKVSTPFSHKYHPEMDTSPFLDDDYTWWYQQLIGILRWSIELGHIDIHLCVALLAQYLAQPCQGHLMQVLHIFGYLKAHSRSKVVFNPMYPKVDSGSFHQADWTDFYVGAKEAIPSNAPKQRGKPVYVIMLCGY